MGNNKTGGLGKYIFFIAIGSFSLAIFFSVISELLVRQLESIALSFIILLGIIFIGIVSDVLGTAVAAAQEAPFHAKSTKRVLGAQQGVMLIRNADKVANIANDVIGDIAGTVSGALGISIVARILILYPDLEHFVLSILITALVASLTITGKAVGKSFALTNANSIIFFAGKVIANMEKIIGRDPYRKNRRNKN